jgi:hypothetical protein
VFLIFVDGNFAFFEPELGVVRVLPLPCSNSEALVSQVAGCLALINPVFRESILGIFWICFVFHGFLEQIQAIATEIP